jgi:hypothetical protein
VSIDWDKKISFAIEFWSLLFVAVFASIPIALAFVFGADFSKPAEPAYISGCITAQGIILGFLSRFITSKKMRSHGIGFLVLLDFLMFPLVVNLLLVNAVFGEPANVLDLSIMIAALSADTATLFIITAMEWSKE